MFHELIRSLAAERVWEYETVPAGGCADVCRQTIQSLHAPLDFPPLEAAIVPGDRIALAVDPNVPQLVDVLQGVIAAIGDTDAGAIDIVLWDEASEVTAKAVVAEVGSLANVTRHDPTERASLRYLAADDAADPIYLNRRLVDADLVLPIMSARPLDKPSQQDLTGVFPALADSATRIRHRDAFFQSEPAAMLPDIPWLLGVHLLLSVRASVAGSAAQVTAGTLEAIGKQLTPTRRQPDEFPPPAPLVIASLDGDWQQQSWTNAARAVLSATRYAGQDGTIVLWTNIDRPPQNHLANLGDMADPPPFQPTQDAEFPPWEEEVGVAKALASVTAEHRLLIHSRLDRETVESMGVGVVDSVEELKQLSQSFSGCGLLRAAQFSGGTALACQQPTG